MKKIFTIFWTRQDPGITRKTELFSAAFRDSGAEETKEKVCGLD